MKNKRPFILYLSLLSAVVLIFIYQKNENNNPVSAIVKPPLEDDPNLGDFSSFQSAATGSTFSGEKIRKFTDFAFHRSKNKIPSAEIFEEDSNSESSRTGDCEKWGVMTTISSPPTEAVRRFLYMTDWCIVVVGDLNKPKDFVIESTLGTNSIYVSSADQKSMNNDFVDSLPWKSFGRKNVGYLYAVSRGAKVIWDFDDDNFLKFWISGAAVDDSLDINKFANASADHQVEVVEPDVDKFTYSVSFNPYPLLGSPTNDTWPRGLPLNEILNPSTWNATLSKSRATYMSKFGVLQSLADIQPDVDAIYRMSRKTPFLFKRTQKAPNEERPILKIPEDKISPYNAQATLHFYNAFWALYLPVTVPGRVSDIWRSFVAQALFKHIGLSVGFLPRPLVVQERNPHSYDADFSAELPLYTQGRAITTHISEQYLTNRHFEPIDNLPRAIEDLWVDLYERGFVEIEDVFLIQRWLKTLIDIGYKFPNTRNTRSIKKEEKNRIAAAGQTVYQLSKVYIEKFYHNSSYKTSTCIHNGADSTGEPLTFANSDLHTGPRADLASLLPHLGQRILLMGPKGNETNYPEIYQNKGVTIYGKMSSTLSRYLDHTHRLTALGIAKNSEYYADDNVVKSVDAFICTFPASMCQIWMALNKNIIFLPAHRYNLGRCTTKEWRNLDEDLRELIADDTKSHTIAAMSRYDTEYLRYYTGIKPVLLSSFSGYYTQGYPYNPTRKEILIFSVKYTANQYLESVKKVLSPDFTAVGVFKLYPFFTFQDLSSHPAVIMLPYSVMSYKLTELYALTIPIFIPSPKFYLNFFDDTAKKRGIGHDRTSTSEPYCTIQRNLESVMRPPISSNFSSHPYSPNVDIQEDPEAEMYWLQLADFYDFPHTQLYDSYQHLRELLLAADLKEIHNMMKAEVEVKGLQVNRKWCDIIDRLKQSKNGGNFDP